MGPCKHCKQWICLCEKRAAEAKPELSAHDMKWRTIRTMMQERGVSVYVALTLYNAMVQ